MHHHNRHHVPCSRRARYLNADVINPNPWASLADLPAFELGAALPPLYVIAEERRKLIVAKIARAIDDVVREALGRWVSELEPVLQFRNGEVFPFGITAKGHVTTYVEIAPVKITYRITDGQDS